ncbi:MAG TPA: hypothetical protein G4N96_06425 [Chloroflexi bacterium]|nr:hypothetical protein [Chloroflexota bacterium]
MKSNLWLGNIPEQKRATYGLLLGVILLTIPCYCLGFMLLAASPEQNSKQPSATAPLVWTPRPTNSPIPNPTFTPYAAQPTNTLQPTPTQFFPTVVLPSPTPTFTVTPQPSPTATNIPASTVTPLPTNTASPTVTATTPPTDTPTPTPTFTVTPTSTGAPPTSTSTPSSTEPTPEPL